MQHLEATRDTILCIVARYAPRYDLKLHESWDLKVRSELGIDSLDWYELITELCSKFQFDLFEKIPFQEEYYSSFFVKKVRKSYFDITINDISLIICDFYNSKSGHAQNSWPQ